MTALLPNAADLTERLDEARAARARLDRLIAWLEDGLDLANWPDEDDHDSLPAAPPAGDAAVPEREQLPGPAETLPVVEREPERELVVPPDLEAGSDSATSSEAPKPEPPAAPEPKKLRAPSRGGARDVEAKVLSTIISANQPVSRAQIAARAGLTVEQLKRPLQRLVADGRVEASGATVSRRYSAGERQWHSQKRTEVEEGLVRNARKVDGAVARVGLRDRVMKAVSADPASLDNYRLALALNATLEDIADACESLVSKNKLQMHSDGTYLRSAAEAAREVAAA